MQIFSKLYQVSGDLVGLTHTQEFGLFNDCNSYVLDLGDQLIMFDCGCGETFSQMLANLNYWHLKPETLSSCFITHAHLDHAGAAHLLKEQGVRLIAHSETAQALAAGDERCAGYLYHNQLVPCTVDLCVDDQQEIKIDALKVQALHLPGHTKGCTAYTLEWEGKSLIISGDIIGTIGFGHFGWDGSIDFDKKTYLLSLKRFAKMNFDIMLPGHGPLYLHNPRRRVEEALNEALIQWR